MLVMLVPDDINPEDKETVDEERHVLLTVQARIGAGVWSAEGAVGVDGEVDGAEEHGEKITLKLVKMKDLWKEGARDAKCLAAVALWEGLRREGKV
ncbi:hypothetical protein N0V88_002652 [Collariella sp. IMI 366227]|nr:hypothetical protein N0V88_002652 [Collariella sp. IMI 366227]